MTNSIGVLRPLTTPVVLPGHADIAGSPPPRPAIVNLAIWNRLKSRDNPVMALFSAPQDRLTGS